MNTRILPPEEWHRLRGTELGEAYPFFDPDKTTIIVVEDGDRVVGCWSLLTVVHVEGLWIDSSYRKGATVGRRLIREMKALAKEKGYRAVVTTAQSDDIVGLVGNMGGHLLPGEHFVIPINIREEDLYRSVGQRFHRQLEELLTKETHPDDDAHNVAVGRALVTAIERGAIADAERVYNAWAESSGYVPIRYLSTRPGASGPELIVDIQSAVIAVDRSFTVTVLEERVCPQSQR